MPHSKLSQFIEEEVQNHTPSNKMSDYITLPLDAISRIVDKALADPDPKLYPIWNISIKMHDGTSSSLTIAGVDGIEEVVVLANQHSVLVETQPDVYEPSFRISEITRIRSPTDEISKN
jgi:hypothetical protein